MTCLTLEQLYSYLEGELTSIDEKALEAHLKSCPSCREALEERRYLLEAAETLPAFEVPGDFSRAVLDRIPAAKARSNVNVLRWLAAAAAGLTAFVAALVATTLITGHSLSQLVLGLNRFLWNNLHSFASVPTKGAKYVYLALKVLAQIAGEILETLKALTSLIGLEAQIAVIGATALLILAGGFLWSRRLYAERNHEE